MALTSLLLIRHAEASGQEADADLTQGGHAQSTALANWLQTRGIDALFSSPYRRAKATLFPFSKQTGLPISVQDGLKERVLASHPQPDWRFHLKRSFVDRAYKLEGGESLEETYERACDALRSIHEQQPKYAAVAAHGNLIASILNRIDPDFGYEAWDRMRNPDVFNLSLLRGVPHAFEQLDF